MPNIIGRSRPRLEKTEKTVNGYEEPSLVNVSTLLYLIEEPDILRLFLKKGGDPDTRAGPSFTRGGQNTLLYEAIRLKRDKLIPVLIEYGADLNIKNHGDWTVLHEAVKRDSEEIAKLLLSKGATVDAQDWQGRSCLHKVRSLGMARILLAAGAEPDRRTTIGHRTPLHEASQRGLSGVVKLLLEKKVAVDAKDLQAVTSLYLARNVETARLLLDAKADPNNKTKKRGWTALHQATDRTRADLVKLLLAHGAAVDIRDNQGRTSLHLARRIEIVRLLLGARANVNARSKASRVPLHEATVRGQADVVKLLLASGADVDAKDSRGRTCLHFVGKTSGFFLQRDDVARVLIDAGADVNVTTKRHLRTPLHEAVLQGQLGLVKMLLDKKAKVDAKDASGRTSLHLATGKSFVLLLLASGANVNSTTTKEQWTPLHGATARRSSSVVKVLLDNGAHVDARDVNGRTSLHGARDARVARWLVAAGADLHIRVKKTGRTPLHEAAAHGLLAVVNVLLEAGAMIDLEDSAGKTPEQLAEAANQKNVVRALREKAAERKSK